MKPSLAAARSASSCLTSLATTQESAARIESNESASLFMTDLEDIVIALVNVALEVVVTTKLVAPHSHRQTTTNVVSCSPFEAVSFSFVSESRTFSMDLSDAMTLQFFLGARCTSIFEYLF